MSASLDDLVAELAPAAHQLVDAAGSAGLMPRVTSTLRTRAEQTRLFRRSQQGLQPYPVAPPGSSAHEYGWAFDLVVSPFDAIYDVAYTWQQWGGGWNANDAVHFEIPGASAEAVRLASTQEPTDLPWWANLLGVGPWWLNIGAADVLKKAVALEKSIGVDAAINYVYKFLGTREP